MSKLMEQAAAKKENFVLDSGEMLVVANRWWGKIKTLQKAGRVVTGIVPTDTGSREKYGQ